MAIPDQRISSPETLANLAKITAILPQLDGAHTLGERLKHVWTLTDLTNKEFGDIFHFKAEGLGFELRLWERKYNSHPQGYSLSFQNELYSNQKILWQWEGGGLNAEPTALYGNVKDKFEFAFYPYKDGAPCLGVRSISDGKYEFNYVFGRALELKQGPKFEGYRLSACQLQSNGLIDFTLQMPNREKEIVTLPAVISQINLASA